MPQLQFPFFPEGVTHITPLLAFRKQDGRVTYFNGSMPVFVHDEADAESFRMITAQFCVNGNARQADIVRAFGVTTISLKRAVKRYRTEGPRGFYTPRRTRGPAVLTAPVLAAAQLLVAFKSRGKLANSPGTVMGREAAGRSRRSVRAERLRTDRRGRRGRRGRVGSAVPV
jgi:hypothetical protein